MRWKVTFFDYVTTYTVFALLRVSNGYRLRYLNFRHDQATFSRQKFNIWLRQEKKSRHCDIQIELSFSNPHWIHFIATTPPMTSWRRLLRHARAWSTEEQAPLITYLVTVQVSTIYLNITHQSLSTGWMLILLCKQVWWHRFHGSCSATWSTPCRCSTKTALPPAQ